jgi:hypothetical protein
LPHTTITPIPNPTICLGDSAQLIAPSSGSNFKWTPSTGLSNSTIYNPWTKPTSSTSYFVRYKDANGCIQHDTVLTVVKICCGVSAKFSVSDSNICSYSESVNINNQSTVTGVPTYTWTFGNHASPSSSSNASPPSIKYSKGGEYVIKLKLLAVI